MYLSKTTYRTPLTDSKWD